MKTEELLELDVKEHCILIESDIAIKLNIPSYIIDNPLPSVYINKEFPYNTTNSQYNKYLLKSGHYLSILLIIAIGIKYLWL